MSPLPLTPSFTRATGSTLDVVGVGDNRIGTGETIDGKIGDNLVRMARMITDLRHATNATGETLQKAEEDKFAMVRQVRDREEKADRLKHRLPWFATGAVVLALVLTIALPRFYASNAATCAALGAEWTRTTSGVDACVFYRE